MIAYDVQCEKGHIFEGWFIDGGSFADQRERGLINCPYCASTRVDRIPSAFAIGKRQKEQQRVDSQSPPTFSVPRELEKYLEKNFEDVGKRFAEEAIKIHFGQEEKRNIRGTTTQEEEKELREEGVPFLKIPLVRYDS